MCWAFRLLSLVLHDNSICTNTTNLFERSVDVRGRLGASVFIFSTARPFGA